MEQLDVPHGEVRGKLIDVEFPTTDEGKPTVKTATLTVERPDGEEVERETTRFAFSQLLKFADLRKKDLKNAEGDVEPTADVQVLEGLVEQDMSKSLVYKYNKDSGRIIGVVSNKFMSIASGEVEQLVRETITSMGVSEFDVEKDPGLVTRMDFVFTDDDGENELTEVGDTLRGGIHVRNSVFGASALTLGRYYVVLACSNGMKVRNTEESFNQIHMGDMEEVRQAIVEETERQIEHLWDETELISNVATIDFEIHDQAEFLWKLAKDRKITKRAAKAMIEEIQKDESDWNTGREDVWGLINAFTGYVEHSDKPSDSSLRKLERVYQDLIEMEERDDVEALVSDVDLDEEDEEELEELLTVE